jgi:biopolymer transport protein TolR
MNRKRSESKILFSSIDTAVFIVIVLLLAIVLSDALTTGWHRGGVSVDLAKVRHPTLMPNADKWDAMVIAIMRDGSVYFDSDRSFTDNLPFRIQDRLRDRGVERKIYTKADARAKYGTLKRALDAVHSAGIEEVGLLVEELRPRVTAQ